MVLDGHNSGELFKNMISSENFLHSEKYPPVSHNLHPPNIQDLWRNLTFDTEEAILEFE